MYAAGKSFYRAEGIHEGHPCCSREHNEDDSGSTATY